MLSAGSGSLGNMLVWQTKMVARLALSNLKTHNSFVYRRDPLIVSQILTAIKNENLNYLNILIFDSYIQNYSMTREKHKKGEPPKYKIIRPNPMINPGLV